MAKAPAAGILEMLACLILFSSCAGQKQVETIKREDLFKVGYGTSETELDFSSPASDHFDAVMREGIFLLLDSGGKKILRLTSYGDLLSLFFDHSVLEQPKTLAPTVQLGEGTGDAAGRKGRSAFAATFVDPSRLAVDSSQTIYIADRLGNPADRVYDALSAAFCDRVVRRFGSSGVEAGYLGQEGPGGTPFPFILSLTILSDDSLVVVAASEKLFLVYRFSLSGSLLSSLRIPRSALPLPKSLSAKDPVAFSVFASLDSILPEPKGETFSLLLKIDYYRNPSSGTIPGQIAGYAGSWILSVDGKSGEYRSMLNVGNPDQGDDIPEFLGVWKDRFYLLSRGSTDGTDRGLSGPGWSLLSLDRGGRLRGRFRLTMPKGSIELATLKLSPSGQIYGVARREKEVAVFWWRLDR